MDSYDWTRKLKAVSVQDLETVLANALKEITDQNYNVRITEMQFMGGFPGQTTFSIHLSEPFDLSFLNIDNQKDNSCKA